jgi:hypothetical protein
MDRARHYLDNPRWQKPETIDHFRHIGTIEPFPYFGLIADAMAAEQAARTARAGFQVIRTGFRRPLLRTVTEADQAALKVRATFRVIR